MQLQGLIQVEGVPEYKVVDLFDPQLSDIEREQVFEACIAIHSEYFPSYPHVIEELRDQLQSNVPPRGERVHAWLVIREEDPVGLWVMNINVKNGIVMMLFGSIHRWARIDLPREYLTHLVNFLLGLCVAEAHKEQGRLCAAVLESDAGHVARWTSHGFFIADPEYREPRHGSRWSEFGDLKFFDEYSACVFRIDEGIGMPNEVLAKIALTTLLVDHYLLPEDHQAVVSSLQRGTQIH